MAKYRNLVVLAVLSVLLHCGKTHYPQFFLLVGQSNMAGRGEIAAENTLVRPGVGVRSVNSAGEQELTRDPLHFDTPSLREQGRRHAAV